MAAQPTDAASTRNALAAPAPGVAVAALGLNLWLTALVVPTVAAHALGVVPLLIPAPLLLVVGLWNRNAPALVMGVPLASLVPLGLPELAVARQQPGPFLVIALALAAYLWIVMRSLAQADAPVEMATHRPLDDAPISPAWPARRRLYTALVVLALAVPAFLLYAAIFDGAIGDAIVASYHRAEPARALVVAAAALLSATVYALCLVRPLDEHLADRGAREPSRVARAPRISSDATWVVLMLIVVGVAAVALVLWVILLDAFWGHP